MSDMWSLFLFNDSTGHALFHEVNMDDFVSAPFPVRGDSLLSVNGLVATQDNYFSLFGTDTPRGEEYEIEFSHLDSVFTTTIATHTIPAAGLADGYSSYSDCLRSDIGGVVGVYQTALFLRSADIVTVLLNNGPAIHRYNWLYSRCLRKFSSTDEHYYTGVHSLHIHRTSLP